MSDVGHGPERPADVVATEVRPVAFLRVQAAVQVLLLLMWGTQALTERDPFHLLLAGLSAVGVALLGRSLVSGARTRLVLSGDTLELRRRLRPVALARADVVAVRGDVRGRPTWSGQVLVETRTGTLRLPALEPGPGRLIPLLQEWAGVGEDPGPLT
ncbi:hypothetical protein [Cellulomonas aerilata]|uniref:DUF304 domain-containing protein n=1 Tax=Cellulomonas aerilata TaxID=515326 RepID=A0A512D7R3_9CELL|nr:hypothetical protein [Cellulomonas aerilata]GEO32509.1 hypothetical protein CAE01nite_02340 [Cellulomonas aerilata]